MAERLAGHDRGMALTFSELCIDANDTELLADFWSAVLGWPRGATDEDGEIELTNPSGAPPTLLFVRVPEGKSVKNRIHIDVSPPSAAEQPAELERLLALGATHVDIGQGAQTWHVLADPEGNEFCLLRGDPTATV